LNFSHVLDIEVVKLVGFPWYKKWLIDQLRILGEK
jgi:hypothetical protein